MRSRGLIVLVAAAVAFLVLRGLVAWRDTSGRVTTSTTSTSKASFAVRTAAAGPVTVRIQPRRVDSSGAEFTVTFDTHSLDLNTDVAARAHLTVGGSDWTSPSWSGDGPGGHHRSGTLRFAGTGPPTGTVTLHLSGLPAPVTASWSVPQS